MAGEAPNYTDWLKTQPCAACGIGGHTWRGPIEVHHPRDHTGLGLRNQDRNGIPMHNRCHVFELHEMKGRFWHFNKAMRKQWERDQIARLRALYGSRESGVSGEVASSSPNKSSPEDELF